jgi:predicted permease
MFRSLFEAYKRLRRQPGLVIVCTLTLAVGLGASFRIVGVMPPAFRYPRSEDLLPGEVEADSSDVWVPLVLTAEERASRDFSDNITIARLAPGVGLDTAQAELGRLGATLDSARPAETQGGSLVVQGLVSTAIGTARRLLWVLLGAVFLVLLVACSNAAHLISTRTLGRAREIGIRAALGASRRHLFGQMMSESIVLAFAGGVLGVLIAVGIIRLLTTFNPGNIPRLDEATVDQRVMLFGFALTILAGVLAGLIPARWASRMHARGLLATNPSVLMSNSVARARPILIVVQVALTIVLVTGAGLLLRSFVTLHRVDTGFETSAFNARLWLDDSYQAAPAQRRFFSELLDRIRARQGVEVAGLVDALPLSHSERMGRFEVQGFANQREQLIHTRAASPGYFEAIGTPLVEGRTFAATDNDKRPRVLIVNQAFARQYFAGRTAVGGRVRFQGDEVSPWYSVIGVVRNVRHSNVEDAPAPQIYECLWQSAADHPYLVVRSRLPPEAVASLVRETAHAIDPAVAIGKPGTMQNLVGAATARRRFETSVLTAFGGVAVLLSAIGLFGLVSYTGRQRRKEIGIRLALGASRVNVVWLLARQGLGLTMAGAALGVVAASFLTRLLQSMLYGVSATDPVSFALAAGTLAMTAAIASYIPSKRATSMDVVEVLRQD